MYELARIGMMSLYAIVVLNQLMTRHRISVSTRKKNRQYGIISASQRVQLTRANTLARYGRRSLPCAAAAPWRRVYRNARHATVINHGSRTFQSDIPWRAAGGASTAAFE